MKISDLKPKMSGVNLSAIIVSLLDKRSFFRFGKMVEVANATIEDETGKVTLCVWNEDIEKVKVGDIVRITNGYVNEFQGEMQLSQGKYGKLEVVKK